MRKAEPPFSITIARSPRAYESSSNFQASERSGPIEVSLYGNDRRQHAKAMETNLVQTTFTLRSNKENGIVFSWLQQKRKETTRRCYQRVVEAFVSRFPDLGIKEISVEHISVFIDERNRLSDSSINERKLFSS